MLLFGTIAVLISLIAAMTSHVLVNDKYEWTAWFPFNFGRSPFIMQQDLIYFDGTVYPPVADRGLQINANKRPSPDIVGHASEGPGANSYQLANPAPVNVSL